MLMRSGCLSSDLPLVWDKAAGVRVVPSDDLTTARALNDLPSSDARY